MLVPIGVIVRFGHDGFPLVVILPWGQQCGRRHLIRAYIFDSVRHKILTNFEGQNAPLRFLSSVGRGGVDDEHLGDERIDKAFFGKKLCQKLPLNNFGVYLGNQRIGKALFGKKLCQKLPLIIFGASPPQDSHKF